MIRRIWLRWKRFGQVVGDFIARLILTIFYFTIFAPFGLGVRLWGDPLAIKKRNGTLWRPSPPTEVTLVQAQRLF